MTALYLHVCENVEEREEAMEKFSARIECENIPVWVCIIQPSPIRPSKHLIISQTHPSNSHVLYEYIHNNFGQIQHLGPGKRFGLEKKAIVAAKH